MQASIYESLSKEHPDVTYYKREDISLILSKGLAQTCREQPRNPIEYGNLLKKKVSNHKVDCWLVNTGWSGGVYGVGKRISIKNTRTLLNAALSGELANTEMRKDPNFGFSVPVKVDGINEQILDPKKTWQNEADYNVQAKN